MTHPPPTPAEFDPLDPHGFERGHPRGHTIVPLRVLAAVLIVLVVFTALTVFASRAEIWASRTFHVEIPQWVNVSVALSIAVVKSLLVLLFFMQLRYDHNKLNAVIFSVCIFALGLFLFFPMTDLGTRGVVYPWKKGEIVRGGTGGVNNWPVYSDLPPGAIVETARQKYIERHGLAAWEAEMAAHHGHGQGHGEDRSGPQRSRPVQGLLSRTEPGDGQADTGH
jgi:caa(3)-type oxidase subunit IV